MATAGEWSGFEDGDVKLNFAGAVFNVHRSMIAEASPVWKAMLTGPFAESTATAAAGDGGGTIHLDGDDPQVARLCIELLYSTRADSDLDWAGVGSRVLSDRLGFDRFVDKYDLRGVRRLVSHELRLGRELRHWREATEAERESGDRRVKAERESGDLRVKRLAAKPGKLVNIFEYRPPVGTRVQLNDEQFTSGVRVGAKGTIIANNEDNGTEIGVRWDNGRESHNLWCGKRGGRALKYTY